MGQIQQLDASLQRAKSAYDSATAQARRHRAQPQDQQDRAARGAREPRQVAGALERRLVAIYTTRDDQSTLAVLLGAQSIDDLVNRIETVQSVSSQDVAVMNQVIGFKHAGDRAPARARACAPRAEAARRAARCSEGAHRLAARHGSSACSRRSRVRSRASSRSSRPGSSRSRARRRPRYTTEQQQQALALQDTVVGASATTLGRVGRSAVAVRRRRRDRDALSRHAVRLGRLEPRRLRLLRPRRLRLRQVGVCLPHYTGAQWNVGVPVSRGDLQPGDLVFFDGLGHVGLYIGGGQFIHAPHTGDVVKISSLSESWYARRTSAHAHHWLRTVRFTGDTHCPRDPPSPCRARGRTVSLLSPTVRLRDGSIRGGRKRTP